MFENKFRKIDKIKDWTLIYLHNIKLIWLQQEIKKEWKLLLCTLKIRMKHKEISRLNLDWMF